MNDEKELLSDIGKEAIQNSAKKESWGDSLSAGKALADLVDTNTKVGELLEINYKEGRVLVHDYARQSVRGLPHGSFLIATRMLLNDTDKNNAEDEDTNIVLLRIIDEAPLPNAEETEHFRFQAGMRSTDTETMWHQSENMDEWTKHNLSFGGYKCRVLGTFRMKKGASEKYHFTFGGDLINFYTGQGMKVFKPTGNLLQKIVNYQRNIGDHPSIPKSRVRVGRIRFASSEVGIDENVDNVPIEIDPHDFIARRTFYGGMSRGGKSNAMKIAAKAIYLIRNEKQGYRVGQLIFDPNGEYANDNPQDSGSLRSVYKKVSGAEYKDEVETYGLNEHPNDEHRKIVKINFYGQTIYKWDNTDDIRKALDQLFVGKAIIDTELQDVQTLYVRNFRNTLIEAPNTFADKGEEVRFRRLITVYRGILSAAGFEKPSEKVNTKGLFNKELLKKMEESAESKISSAGTLLGKDELPWDSFVEACKGLRNFMKNTDKSGGYDKFEREYSSKKDGRRWADDGLTNILEIYAYPNGVAQLRHAARQHSARATSDYASDIVTALRDGKLVIFDQSTGDPIQNVNAAERILWRIFNRQKQDFIDPKMDESGKFISPPPVMVYLEEAHNLLPAKGSQEDLRSIWARTAKEGSKYKIGMVLATQEPSSVMPAILKNTDNWFIAHLNNLDEIKTLSKFYDFEDYNHQIKTITDPGFVRMRTLSNPFTIPVQIDLFVGDNSQ